MRIILRANQVGQMVMPAHVRKVWGNEYELLPNSMGGAIYPKGTNPKDVVASFKVVIQDLQNEVRRRSNTE